MTQSEQLAQVRKALDRAVGCLSLARNGMLEVTHLTIYTCDAVTTWLAYVVKQEEERVHAEAIPLTRQELIIAYYRKRFTQIIERYTEADISHAYDVALVMFREAQQALEHNQFDLWMHDELQEEEERVQAEATKGQMTHQEFVDEILRQAEKTKREGEYGQGHDTTGRL